MAGFPRLDPEREAVLRAAVILASDPHVVGVGIPLQRDRQLIGMPLIEFSKHRIPRHIASGNQPIASSTAAAYSAGASSQMK